MKFIEFRNNLQHFPVFSIDDIRKIEPAFHSQRLIEWQKKGYLKKIASRYYFFHETEINLQFLYFAANQIYRPSYISFESALSFYNLIPEGVFNITSACTKRTYSFNAGEGRFYYHKIRPELYFGFRLEMYGSNAFKIAMPEKSILDFFYINSYLDNPDFFAGLRFDKDIFFSIVNIEIMSELMTKFNNRKLNNRINKFIKFLKNE